MDVLRNLAWWGITYGSIACLWMAAQVKADLRGQPESPDESVMTIYYGPADMESFDVAAANPTSPPDHTIASAAAAVPAGD